MSKQFVDQRRQQFIPEPYYKAMTKFLEESAAKWKHGMVNVDASEDYRRNLAIMQFVDDTYELWSLRFTGGEPLETLREEIEGVVSAYEYQKGFVKKITGIPYAVVLAFEEKDEYERAMQLISASILLHREDLLNRLTAMIDPGYKGQDAILEKLLSFRQEGRTDMEQPFHKKPYTTLLQVMREENKEKAVDKLKTYCKEWYPAFKQAPWHDGHLRINGNDGDYFGYRAFEAGAVAYLYGLDDSKIDHIVYPKDLVDFARNFKK